MTVDRTLTLILPHIFVKQMLSSLKCFISMANLLGQNQSYILAKSVQILVTTSSLKAACFCFLLPHLLREKDNDSQVAPVMLYLLLSMGDTT